MAACWAWTDSGADEVRSVDDRPPWAALSGAANVPVVELPSVDSSPVLGWDEKGGRELY